MISFSATCKAAHHFSSVSNTEDFLLISKYYFYPPQDSEVICSVYIELDAIHIYLSIAFTVVSLSNKSPSIFISLVSPHYRLHKYLLGVLPIHVRSFLHVLQYTSVLMVLERLEYDGHQFHLPQWELLVFVAHELSIIYFIVYMLLINGVTFSLK